MLIFLGALPPDPPPNWSAFGLHGPQLVPYRLQQFIGAYVGPFGILGFWNHAEVPLGTLRTAQCTTSTLMGQTWDPAWGILGTLHVADLGLA